MVIEVAIVERIRGIAAVAAIVGARVYQLRLPQRPTLPAVRVQLISDVPDYHLRGQSGVSPARVQVDAFAEERSGVDAYAQATALGEAIEGGRVPGSPPSWPAGLSGWRGDMGGSPPTVRIALIKRIDRDVLYEAGELGLVRVRQDFDVWWQPL